MSGQTSSASGIILVREGNESPRNKRKTSRRGQLGNLLQNILKFGKRQWMECQRILRKIL